LSDAYNGSGDLEADAEFYSSMLASAFEGYAVISEPAIYDMNGTEAIQFTFDVSISDMEMRMTYFLFYIDSTLCYGTAGSLKDTYIDEEAEMNQLITSAITVNK